MRRRWTSTCTVEIAGAGLWPSWHTHAQELTEDDARSIARQLLRRHAQVRILHDHKSGVGSGIIEVVSKKPTRLVTRSEGDARLVGNVEVSLAELADAWAHGWTMAEIASEWGITLTQAWDLVDTLEVAA